MTTWYKVYLDGFEFYVRHVQSDPSDINNRTRGGATPFNLSVPQSPDNLVISSGETHTVEAGTVEVWNDVTVDGELTVNGILVVYGTLDSVDGTVNSEHGTIDTLTQNPFSRLLAHDRHAGSYTLTETLGNAQKYKERLPASPNINSLVVGLEPATDLSDRDIAGKWGLISNVTDNRTRALTNPVVTLEIDILAEYSEFNDVAAVKTDLEI